MLDADVRARRLRTMPGSDLANAEAMAVRYEKHVIFVPAMGFLTYVDGLWQRDPNARLVRHLAGEHAKAMCMAVLEGVEEDRIKDVKRAALKWQNRKQIDATVSLLSTVPDIAVPGPRLNRDSLLFNVRNGTVDLRTGDLRPHDPADLITMQSPVVFDADAQCPMWTDFMERVSAERFGGSPRKEWIAFMQRLAGYLLTGETKEQKLFFFLGEGANGKGTWVEVMRALLGPYASVTNSSTFMRTRTDQHPTAVADIAEARFVYCEELAEDARIDEERMKSMTGEGRQKARFMRENFFEFDPRWKIIFNTNHLPTVPTGGRATWRRLIPVPFDITIPEKKRDVDIVARLRTELPGILNWAVAGCITWRLQGLNPNTVECIEARRVEYHEEEDHVGAVLRSICTFGDGLWVRQTDLYMAYRRACIAQGVTPLDGNVFGRRLNDRKIPTGRSGKAGDRIRVGLALQEGVAAGLGDDAAAGEE